MKNIVIVFVLCGLLSCSGHRRESESFPNLLSNDIEWITYEGILPGENGGDVLVELALMPGTPGMDSYYKLTESIFYTDQEKPRIVMSSSNQGQYSVLFGSAGNNILEIKNRQLLHSVRDARVLNKDEHIMERLYLKSIGDHQLVMTNENFEVVDPRYTLIRRSDLFTVEGHFTVYGDTTEYFERNTRKRWAVAQFGRYNEAVNSYNSLARVDHEGIYLKALAYSIRHTDNNGNEVDALVFKTLLRMDSAILLQ